jgi:hypothetical protein
VKRSLNEMGAGRALRHACRAYAAAVEAMLASTTPDAERAKVDEANALLCAAALRHARFRKGLKKATACPDGAKVVGSQNT